MPPADPDSTAASHGEAPQLPREKILKGLRYFAIFTVVGLAVVFYNNSTSATLTALTRLETRYLVLAAVLQVAIISLGALRNHTLVRRIKPGVSPRLCLKGQLGNEFGAAVSPGQSGGGPVWLFLLYRGGVQLASAVAVSVLIWVSTLAFFLIATSASIYFLSGRYSDESLSLLPYAFLVCGGVFVSILLALWQPHRVEAGIVALTRWLKSSPSSWMARLARAGESVSGAIHQFESSSMLLVRNHPMAVAQSSLLTCVYYLAKLHLAYLLLRGLGVEIDYMTALAILALLQFSLYFMPTPGGSGMGDIVIALLMSGVMPDYLLPIYVVLYRSFHLFMPGAVGAWVLLRELRADDNG